MKHKIRRSAHVAVAALALALLASRPLPAQTTATFNLTGVGSGLSLAGVYTSPYSGNINGGTTIPVICDDFADDSYIPESWTAYVTSLSSIISGSANTSVLKWQPPIDTSPTISQAQAYEVAAILSIDILDSAGDLTPLGTNAQQAYSYALWGLFDPTDAFGQLSGLGNDQTTAETDLSNAITEVTSSASATAAYLSNYNVTIYSYDGKAGNPTCNGSHCPSAPPQEFITVSMAEPPSLAVFAVYFLLGGGGLLFFGRRHIFSQSR